MKEKDIYLLKFKYKINILNIISKKKNNFII